MMIRRVFSGSMVALLLSVPSLAAACDVSCAFASMNSDCHSQQVETQDSAGGGIRMDGMAMDGMAMPGMEHNQGQRTDSAISSVKAIHPSIGEMGACEKQPCEGDSAISVKARASSAPPLNLILAVIKIPHSDHAPPLFSAAREDIATRAFQNERPLRIALRV
jgi:hypothetical protein